MFSILQLIWYQARWWLKMAYIPYTLGKVGCSWWVVTFCKLRFDSTGSREWIFSIELELRVKFDWAWKTAGPSCLFCLWSVSCAGRQQAQVTDMTYWGSLQLKIDSRCLARSDSYARTLFYQFPRCYKLKHMFCERPPVEWPLWSCRIVCCSCLNF